MYEFRHSDKKVTWYLPEGFHREETRRTYEEQRRLVSPSRRIAVTIGDTCAGIGMCLLLFVALTPLHSTRLESISRMLLYFGISLSLLYRHRLPRMSGKVEITKRTMNGIKWRSVVWWTVVDAGGPSGLRAVEFQYPWLGKHTTERLGFDPAEVDEGIVTDFLRLIAPEKERVAV
jgi:hypothetical protein